MATTKPVPVEDLSLDLGNYRALPQRSEAASLQAIINVDPDWFWALLDSLITDGYLPTENVIVLKRGNDLIVKEGNRRVGAMKLAHGLLRGNRITLPPDLATRVKALDEKWKEANKAVPCTIYPETEAKTVDNIVTLIHGKGQKAGRLVWNAVARARHNRNELKKPEPALDLLERYLREGRNLTPGQKDRWAGDYAITVLEEAVKRLGTAYGKSAREVADLYPTKHRDAFEALMIDIGLGQVGFDKVRNSDFIAGYGFPEPIAKKNGRSAGAQSGTDEKAASGSGGKGAKKTDDKKEAGGETQANAGTRRGHAAVATTDPRSIKRHLKDFTPRGKRREKLVDLVEEARQLDVKKTPLAFCFVLRSMFEISAKAYCLDNAASGLSATKNGFDRQLVDVLRDAVKHLTKNNSDTEMVRRLHGAMAELGNQNGILSVTSMNQLIHNPRFTVDASHICTVFGNVFPLLEELNK